MLDRKPRAVSVVSVVSVVTVVTVAAATTAVMNRRANHATNHVQSLQREWTQTRQAITPYRVIRPTCNAHRANGAAATATAVNGASAVRVPNALKIVLKCLLLLKIQYQVCLQPSKYGRKQLLNL